jgi:PAS domain S-box-containing protein
MANVAPTGVEQFFNEDEIIVSKTDTKGHITYGNEVFLKLAGYDEEELLGAPHNIIRHPDMPKAVFKLLWDTIQDGKEINAYVINLAKDGSHYWVFANVTPSFDSQNNIIGYYSVRRVPSQEVLKETIIPLYKKLKELEDEGGVDKSVGYLVSLLEDVGKSYEEFIFSLEYGEKEASA